MAQMSLSEQVSHIITRGLRDLIRTDVMWYKLSERMDRVAQDVLEVTGVPCEDTAKVIEVVLASRDFVKLIDECLSTEEQALVASDDLDRLRAALKAIRAYPRPVP